MSSSVCKFMEHNPFVHSTTWLQCNSTIRCLSSDTSIVVYCFHNTQGRVRLSSFSNQRLISLRLDYSFVELGNLFLSHRLFAFWKFAFCRPLRFVDFVASTINIRVLKASSFLLFQF